MKRTLVVILLMFAVLLTAACAPSAPPEQTEPTAAPTEKPEEPKVTESETEAPVDVFRVAMILPGLVSDAGWNAGGFYAVEYLNENVDGVEAKFIENVSLTNAESAMRDYCEQGYDMVVGWSIDFGDYLQEVAPDYPDVQFVWSQGWMTLDNMCTAKAPLQETAYLCGIIAAGMSETGIIGYIGGMDTMPMINALEAYKDGAKSYNPDAKVIHAFAGTWEDVEKGKQTALAQFEQGVDIMMARGDGIALGGLQACLEKGVYLFGDVSDQNSLAPELLLTSTGWNVGKNLEYIIDDVRKDGKPNGNAYNLGMMAGVTDITDFHGLVPDDLAKVVYDVRDKIISGELVIEAKTEISD